MIATSPSSSQLKKQIYKFALDLFTSQKTLLTRCSSLSLNFCKTLHNLKSNCQIFLEKIMQTQIRSETIVQQQQQQQQLLLKEAWREIVVGEDEYCNLL